MILKLCTGGFEKSERLKSSISKTQLRCLDKVCMFKVKIKYVTKAMISGLRCVNEGHEFLKKA